MFRKSISILIVLSIGICSVFAQEGILKWGVSEETYPISSELENRLVVSLLQEMVRSKVEKDLLALEVPYRIQSEKQLFPCQFSVLFDRKEEGKIENLKKLLSERDSCFLDEFETVKKVWLDWIDQKKMVCANSNQLEFLENSEKILRRISSEDVSYTFQKDMKSNLKASQVFARNYASTSSFLPQKQAISYMQGARSSEIDAFLSLPMDEDVKRIVKQFIFDFADRSLEDFMKDREKLESIRFKLDSIHPLRFAGFLFSDPELLQCARRIMATDGKSHMLVALLMLETNKRKETDLFREQLSGFVAYIGADRNTVQQFINQNNYRGLVDYLLQL